MKILLAGLSLLALMILGGIRVYASIEFDIAIGNHIERAATSPDPAIASDELGAAIVGVQAQGLTSGNTGIFFRKPVNDLGFWYQRLVDSRTILQALPKHDSALEISNTMMRVHESITEGGAKGGTEIVCPDGISIYPNNALFFWGFLLALLFLIGSMIAIVVDSV